MNEIVKLCPICNTTVLNEDNTHKKDDIDICEDCYFDMIDEMICEQLIF